MQVEIMKGTYFKYLLVFIVGIISFSSCSDWEEDENDELNREIRRELSGKTWVAISVTNENGEPFFDAEGYEIIPEDFGFLRFEDGVDVDACYTSNHSFLEFVGEPYYVVRDQQLMVGEKYYPLVWNGFDNEFTLKCRYYYDTVGNYLIYFVTFKKFK